MTDVNGPAGTSLLAALPARRVLWLATLVILPALGLALLWLGRNALFLLFAGILLAAVLDALIRALESYSPLSRTVSAGAVVGAVIALLLALAWFGGSALVGSASDLYDALDRQATALGNAIDSMRAGDSDLGERSLTGMLSEIGRMWDGAGGLGASSLVQSTFGALANAFLILFIGIFLALDPSLYKRGLVALFPPDRRTRVDEALHAAGDTLRQWLIGKLASMALIGVLTFAGLAIVGYPFALPLALLAGALAFIPNLGPLLTYVPIALVGFSAGLTTVAMGVAVYAVAQSVESYVFTPLVQRRLVSLPPALILFAQVLGGVLFGLWGVALATPLAAVLRLWVDRLYVHEALEDEAPPSARPGEREREGTVRS